MAGKILKVVIIWLLFISVIYLMLCVYSANAEMCDGWSSKGDQLGVALYYLCEIKKELSSKNDTPLVIARDCVQQNAITGEWEGC